MTEVTVVCLAEDRTRAVERLGELGIVHVKPVQPPDSEELDRMQRRRDRFVRALGFLPVGDSGPLPGAPQADEGEPDAEQICAQVLYAAQKMAEAEQGLAHWTRVREELAPWGSFSMEAVTALRERGLDVRFCVALEAEMPELPGNAIIERVSRDGKRVHFVVIGPEKLEFELPEVALPEITDRLEVSSRLDECQTRKAEAAATLDTLRAQASVLSDALKELDNELEFTRARDGMGQAEQLTYLTGYVPARSMDALRAAANTNGWALRHRAAELEDPEVPTLLRIPRLLRIAKPIFDFIGIRPGYNETDVSACMMIFLAIFFGMIVGDAGYGILFLLIGVLLKWKVRDPSRRLPIHLFLVLGAVTLVWGGLNGNYFAIPSAYLPRGLRGLRWFTDEAVKNRHIQWLCFVIGAVHLSLARGWQAVLKRDRREALGEVGWAILIWANFFTAVELIVSQGSFPTFAYWFYGVGAAMILVFGVNWRDVSSVFNIPFNLIGSFVDILSYVRLFAVGLSSYYIARSFNDMGKMVFDLSPWLIVPAALVILFGHLLNIALAFMGVLVHGIRLNTLEFSNHMGLSWSGRMYAPLRRRTS